MHQELAAAAQRHALHRSHGRYLSVFQRLRSALELLDRLFQNVEHASRAGLADLLQVGTDGERRLMPDNDAIQRLFGLAYGSDDAIQHLVTDGMHLRLDGNDADSGVDRRNPPQPDAVVLVQRLAGLLRCCCTFAKHALGEKLTLVDRQCRTRRVSIAAGRIRPLRRMDASTAAFQHPGRQVGVAHGLAGSDVGSDGLRDI